MPNQVYVLDSSGIIGGFFSKKLPNFTTSQVIMEIKDLKSKIFLQSALEDGHITITEPTKEDLNHVEEVITGSGDILRLSDVDKQVIALALTLQKDDMSPTVVTDDYSIQNVLKIMKIPFKSVLTRGIEDVVGWIKFCKGCKKIYSPDYSLTECEICGSPISRKRKKK
ncbi:MAG: ribonuclease VapC [Methanobacterium sp.]|nr:ribonuclease VapC [Methanobacterium sp.]